MAYYRFTRLQQYINGQPTDVYSKGERVDDVDYSTYDDCMGGTAETRWIPISQTVCYNGDLWSMEKEQISYDEGATWTDTGNTRRASVIESSSSQCSGANNDWRVVYGEYICDGTTKCVKEAEYVNDSPTGRTRAGSMVELLSEDCGVMYQWVDVPGEFICVYKCGRADKYTKQKQQYSLDNGVHWEDTGETREGNFIEKNSADCGCDTSITRWVTVSEEYVCVGTSKYTKEKEQSSTDGTNWTDTGNTRAGSLIEASSTDCASTRWVTVSGEYSCVGTDKYNLEKEQMSTDGGATWTDTGSTRAGSTLIEADSTDCGYVPTPITRWVEVSGEYVCIGTDKYNKEKEQISYDSGSTWGDTGNTRAGSTLIEANSTDCGYDPHDYSREYLTISSLEDNNEIKWIAASRYFKRTVSVSTDNGQTWTEKASSPDTGTTLATLNAGDKLLVKGLNSTYRDSLFYFIYFSTTKDFSVYGNIMSLIGGDDFANITSFTNKNVYAFGCLFWSCSHLVDASNLILPVTTLAESCYANMFQGCTSLTTAPALPATTLANQCYKGMFSNCTSLTTAPALPATKLEYECCYKEMFKGCTSLTTVILPATELASMCYESMFEGCTSLTTVILPATELAYECYYSMFKGCTSLTTAPDLPATSLAGECYKGMFSDCTSLTTAPALPATKLEYECYDSMFKNCTGLTTAPDLPATSLSNECYDSMFQGCTKLTTAPALPATRLAYACYVVMFKGCTSLTTAPDLPATALSLYCYQSMFQGCTSLTTAPELPATSLSNECYKNMFKGCTSLTTAPALPATTLDGICYESMFEGCTSLTTAPELPATTLRNYCYESMFSGCTSLTTAPELPATTLGVGCYESMFKGCTSLTTAPDLPTTTLKNNCYESMFAGCTGLTTAPELPAETLVSECYRGMFSDCTSLNYIKCLATDIYASNCTTNWLQGVSSTGIFVKNAAMSSWGRGTGRIPSGWTVQDA